MNRFDPTFLVGYFGFISIEILKAIPGMVTGWVQLLIALMTILYLYLKIKHINKLKKPPTNEF